jgi:hypothetical protein
VGTRPGHPPAPDLYLEVREVPELLDELGELPLPQLARDAERVEASGGWIDPALFEPEELAVRLTSLLGGALAGSDDGSTRAIVDTLRECRLLSFSMTAAQSEHAQEFDPRDPERIALAVSELRRIEALLALHAEFELEPVEDLAQLLDAHPGVAYGERDRTGRPLDPWGNPYVLDVGGPEAQPTPRSLGADSETGGVLADADLLPSTSVVGRVTSLHLTQVHVALVLEMADEESGRLAERAFVDVVAPHIDCRVELRGTALHVRAGVQQSDAERAPDGRARRPRDAALGARAPQERVTLQVSRGAANGPVGAIAAGTLSGVLAALLGDTSAPLFSSLLAAPGPGASPAPSLLLHAGAGEGRWRMRGAVSADARVAREERTPRAAGDDAEAGRADERATMRLVPRDTVVVFVGRKGDDELAAWFLNMLQLADGLAVGGNRSAARSSEPLQASFAALGESLVGPLVGFVRGPTATIVQTPPFFAIVRARDTEQLATSIEGLARVVREDRADVFEVRTRTSRGTEMTSLEVRNPFGDSGFGPTLAPTLSVVGEHLLVAPSHRAMRTWLRELAREDEGGSPLAVVAGSRAADSTAVVDWGLLVERVFALARAFGPMLARNADGLPFEGADLHRLPPAEVFTAQLSPTVFSSSRDADGTLRFELESSFGPETWIGLPAYAFVRLSELAVVRGAASGALESGR